MKDDRRDCEQLDWQRSRYIENIIISYCKSVESLQRFKNENRVATNGSTFIA